MDSKLSQDKGKKSNMSSKGGRTFKPSKKEDNKSDGPEFFNRKPPTQAPKRDLGGKERDLVKFSMGGGSSKLDFKDDGTKYNQFQKESTFTDSYYTTDLDESKYTKEQKLKAARIEKEIAKGKKSNFRNDHEDDDEEMDNKSAAVTQNYDQFVEQNAVLDIADLERKQLSGKLINTTQDSNTPGDLSSNDLMKKESQKSINDFEIGDMSSDTKPPAQENESNNGDKPKMKMSSRSFTPKAAKPTSGSTKSIDEFEISEGKAPEKKAEAPKPKKTSKLTLRSNTKSFVPTKKAPISTTSTLSQSTAPAFRPKQPSTLSQTVTPTQPPPKPYYPRNDQYKNPPQPTQNYPAQHMQNDHMGGYGQYNQGRDYNGYNKQAKLPRYYKLDEQINLESFFCYKTFCNNDLRKGYVKKIQDAKEEQMNKSVKNTQNYNQGNNYSSYPRSSIASSYANGGNSLGGQRMNNYGGIYSNQ